MALTRQVRSMHPLRVHKEMTMIDSGRCFIHRPEFLISKKRKEKDEGKGGGKEKKESPTTNYDNF